MVLAVWNGQHVLLSQSSFHLLGSCQIQDTIQNMNISFIISKTIQHVNSLRPRQNRRHFADDIFKCIFLNENVWIPIKISLKFVPKDPINNIPALVQIMAWRRPGDKPLSEPIMVTLLTHICVTRPQWVKSYLSKPSYTALLLYPSQIYHWGLGMIIISLLQTCIMGWLGNFSTSKYDAWPPAKIDSVCRPFSDETMCFCIEWVPCLWINDYRQFSNIRRTQSQNIKVSRLVLMLSLPNPLKPCVKLRMKM